MKTKFMGVAAALTAALALVFGVAIPGALPSLPAPTAQAQDRSFTIAKQQKYTQKGDRHIPNYKIPADQLSGGTLTLGAGTVVTLESSTTFYSAPNPADFTVYYTGTGGGWNETQATYKRVSGKKYEVTLPEITIGGAAEIEFKGVHRGSPNTVISAKFDVVGGTTQPPVTKPDREWTGTDTHGQFTMRATQGQEPTVTFSRKLGEDGTLSGAIEAWVTNKNGYDVDGTKASKLRITGPDGRVIHEASGAPYSDNVTPIQNWAGVKFALPKNLEVDAGTTIEIVSPYGFRQANPVIDSSIQSPIGPGTFKINFEKASTFQYPNQTQAVCNPLTAQGDVNGFRIFPRSDAKRQIREVRAVYFLDPDTGQLTRINEPFDVVLSPSGVNDTADVRFKKAVPNRGNRSVCAVVNFDADREIKTGSSGNQPADHFTLAARRDVYPKDGNDVYQNSQIEAPIDWDKPQEANPKPVPRCGQNIAIVLDASNSVIAKNGVDAEANAARRIVEALSGTATSVGVYNFASAGTRFNDAKVASTPLADPEGKKRVLQAIEKYRTNMKKRETRESSGQGATNWEGALKEIEAYNSKNENKKYDVVYFVTDGFPTFSDSEKPGGGDDGSAGIVHVSDVTRARDAADTVKKQGTRIQPVLVNIPSNFKEPIAKDSTAEVRHLDRYRKQYGKAPAHAIMVWESADQNASFVRDQLNSQRMDVFGLREDTLWGQGLGDVLASDTAPAKQPLPDNRRKDLGDQDWKTWAVDERTATQMGDIISGPGTSVLAETFGDLDRVLSELALASCAGTVSLQKSVVTPDGKAPDEPKLDGWEFTAQTKGNNLLDPDGKRVNQTTGKTDDRGSLTFNLETDAPDQKPKVRISEKQQAGHSLLRQKQSDGSEAYAVCTAHSNKGGRPEQLIVKNPEGSADSFDLEVAADSIVNCSVVNQMDPEKGYFRVEKVNENGDPLEGSRFEVWRADSTGTKPTGDGPVWRTGQESTVRMDQGNYVLIETKAPGGYSLLPQPIAFRIGLDGVKQKIELTGKQGASFVLESGPDEKTGRTGTFMKVANVTVGELPKTGGHGVGLVGLIGAALAGAGLLLGRRKTA